MTTIDKYLLREYLIPVGYCLAAFCMIFVVYDLFDHLSDFLEAATPWTLALRYYVFFLTPVLEYLVPASLLLATLYTLWQFARNNELTAMRASGISLYRIMLPFLAVGMLFSLGTAVVRETVGPYAALWATRFVQNDFKAPEHNVQRDRAYYNRSTHRLWLIEEIDLDDPHRLVGVKITQERPDRSRVRQILADRAEYLDGEWWLFDAKERAYNEAGYPVAGLAPVPGSADGVVAPYLTEEPADFVNEIRPWEFLSALAMWRYLEAHPHLSAETAAQKRFDFHNRLATPWACLVVTLFGIPAGARSGRQSVLSGILLAISFFFGFYAFSQMGIFLGKRQILWPWLAAWLPNITFLGAGGWMAMRMR